MREEENSNSSKSSSQSFDFENLDYNNKDSPTKISESDLTTELRHKYLTILKSLYWEYYEEGQCSPDAVVVLMEAADRALDHESTPMQDWDFILSYFISERILRCSGSLAKIPLIGYIFSQYLFTQFSFIYDVGTNFVEAHEEASNMLVNMINEKDFVTKIKSESVPNTQKAENYLNKYIEDMFPEITKAIQHRKAQYYLLIHEYHFTEEMQKKG